MMKNNIGLVSISFRQHASEDILKAMKKAGLSHIEWGSDVHAPYTETERLYQLAALQKEYDITCSSYGTYFKFGVTPIEELEGYIKAAKILGTRILRLWCGAKSGSDMTEVERTELLSLCSQAARIAEERDVILCMECHKKTFTENLADTLLLMKTVNSPNFRMYWQPFQWLEPEENAKIAHALAPYTEHIHVFNWKGTEKFPLQEAVEIWREYMKAFDGCHTLLLEFMPDNRIESLDAEASALREIAQ